MSDRESAGPPTTPAPPGDHPSPAAGEPTGSVPPAPPPTSTGPAPAGPAWSAYPAAPSPAPVADPGGPPEPNPAPSAYPAPPVGYSAASASAYPSPGYAPPAQPGYPGASYPGQAPAAYPPSTYPGGPSQYPGHPGYPGGWPPPGRTRGRLGLMIGVVAAVVVLLAGGITIALLVMATNSPRASLEGWFEAARSGDITELRSLTCAQYAHADFDPVLLADVLWEIHEIRRIDDTLVEATLTVHSAGGVSTERWAIVKEDGAWKVCGPVAQLVRT
jgi:hypothetical protein